MTHTEHPISRQLKWQRKKVSMGLCRICSKKEFKKGHCRKHYEIKRRQTADWIKKNKIRHLELLRNWRIAHPNYMRDYGRRKRNNTLSKEDEKSIEGAIKNCAGNS